MTLFRPCIDLHEGKVKQIVGGTLNDQGAKTNFVSEKNSDYFADLYKSYNLTGGHVIGLGPGNETAAKLALSTWRGKLQYGGGINPDNAIDYLDAGAEKVIVTSYIFDNKELSLEKLKNLHKIVGSEQLVLDLSCRKVESGWAIATNRWQTVTSTLVNQDTLEDLSQWCSEFLIHAADVEGLQQGIDSELVQFLGKHCPIPVTYAGGASSMKDLEMVDELSNGKVDLTIGSALDIFGGNGVKFKDCVEWNQQKQ